LKQYRLIRDQAAIDRLPKTLVRILRSNDAVIDPHGLALRQVADIGNQVQRAIETRIDDDDVGQFRLAAHQRFQTVGSLGDEKIQARKDALPDLAYDVRIIGNHQALHLKLPLSATAGI
jgi:hypothetical protein